MQKHNALKRLPRDRGVAFLGRVGWLTLGKDEVLARDEGLVKVEGC